MEDWQIEDPEGKPINKVREIRDEVKARIKRLIEELGREVQATHG
jgi:arsenate reductase